MSLLNVKTTKTDTTIYLYGVIGRDFTDIDFIAVMNNVKSPHLNIRINSPGGSVFMGNAIFNAIKNFKGTVSTWIDGAAFSMASIIALAGNKVFMARNAMYMIHNPSAGHDPSEKDLEVLHKVKSIMLGAYNSKSGIPIATLDLMLNKETFFTAEEAKTSGFIDEIVSEVLQKNPTAYKHVAHSAMEIYNEYKSININTIMELSQLLSLLKLPADATEADVIAAIEALQLENKEAKAKSKEATEAKKDVIEAVLVKAIEDKKITANLIHEYRAMLESDFAIASKIIASMNGLEKPNPKFSYGSEGKIMEINGKLKSQWSLDDYRQHAPLELEKNPSLYKKLCDNAGIKDE